MLNPLKHHHLNLLRSLLNTFKFLKTGEDGRHSDVMAAADREREASLLESPTKVVRAYPDSQPALSNGIKVINLKR